MFHITEVIGRAAAEEALNKNPGQKFTALVPVANGVLWLVMETTQEPPSTSSRPLKAGRH